MIIDYSLKCSFVYLNSNPVNYFIISLFGTFLDHLVFGVYLEYKGSRHVQHIC